MKKITAICDMCGVEKEYNLGADARWPRFLHIVGNMELCDWCKDNVMEHIRKEAERITGDGKPGYKDQTYVPAISERVLKNKHK